jgi:dihydrofolate reductase
MSADGFVAGPNQSLENPLGEGGGRLHEWVVGTRGWRAMHGMEGGDTGPGHDLFLELFQNLGATIMGRNMFGGGHGPWDESWRGWWDENPPFHTPVFVLTHHARRPLEMEGGTTFHFVTDGIHAALDSAKRAAGEKDVAIAGGAAVAQQYLRANLIDRMDLHVAPVLLGGGSRLFENTGGAQSNFECVRIRSSPAAAHFQYRRR